MKDKRSINAVRNDEAHDALIARRGTLRAEQIEAARLFYTLDACAHFVFSGCANIREFGERNGFSSHEAARLACVGLALIQIPDLEEDILTGDVSIDNAAIVGRALGNPMLSDSSAEWVLRAKTMTTASLERLLKKKVAEAKTEQEPILMAMYVTPAGQEKFHRARKVASRKAEKALSDGETLEELSDHYLDSFDPDRVKPGKRRMPDTSRHPETGKGGHPGRTVPTEVRREIRQRSGDRCEVDDCENDLFIEFAHLDPHALGGSRELSNGKGLCSRHHTLFDQGHLRIEETPEGTVFRDRDGNILGKGKNYRLGLGNSEASSPENS